MLDKAIESTTSINLSIGCSLGYLYSLYVLLNYMKKTDKKYYLKKVLMCYNTVQIAVNTYIIYGT